MASKAIKTIRAGGIQLTIWENESTKGSYNTVSIDRSYKDDKGWKQTKTLRPTDLPLVQAVISEAVHNLFIKNSDGSKDNIEDF